MNPEALSQSIAAGFPKPLNSTQFLLEEPTIDATPIAPGLLYPDWLLKRV